MHRTFTIALAALLFGSPVMAQDHGMHGGGPAAVDLPAICLANAPADAMPMPHAMAMPSPAHEALMADMDRMNADMMAGGTAADIDVAFVCSMIPHHRGAVAMSKAELAHGDDPFARQLAETIIAAQEQEIADMLDWLARQSP